MASPLKTLPALLLLLAGALPAGAAGETYCCQEANGHRACGDSLPDQCRGRAYRILDRSGNLLREVGPPLTAEQKAQRDEETRRQQQAEEAAREQRRRDQALLDTYAAPEDIDQAQQKAENDVNLTIKSTQSRIDAAAGKRQKLLNEAEFYRKSGVPPQLSKDLQALDHEIKVQQELLAVKQREAVTIRSKYDADRQRYVELTGRRSKAAPAGAGR